MNFVYLNMMSADQTGSVALSTWVKEMAPKRKENKLRW